MNVDDTYVRDVYSDWDSDLKELVDRILDDYNHAGEPDTYANVVHMKIILRGNVKYIMMDLSDDYPYVIVREKENMEYKFHELYASCDPPSYLMDKHCRPHDILDGSYAAKMITEILDISSEVVLNVSKNEK
jgi:hypothetical protein